MGSTTTKPNQHVLIIGAGITGLAIAHGLSQCTPPIPYTIFEAESESTYRPREWTMALHWSIPMLKSLLPPHLATRLLFEVVVDRSLDWEKHENRIMKIYDGVNGDVMKEIPMPEGFRRVSRRKLRALCGEGVDVKWGHVLKDVAYGEDGTVTAKFENGEEVEGTLIVGADGARSAVRQRILGPEKGVATPLEIVHTNNAFQYDTAEKARFVRTAAPIFSQMVHPDCIVFISIQDVPDPEKPETWRFQIVVGWKAFRDEKLSNEEKRKEIMDRVQHMQEPFRSAVMWIPEGIEIQYNDLASWQTQEWDTRAGRVALAGDAAHSMPPHRGQGVNQAINDAYNLVGDLQKVATGQAGQAESMDAYMREVVERGSKEVILSKESAWTQLDYASFKDSVLVRHGLERSPEEHT